MPIEVLDKRLSECVHFSKCEFLTQEHREAEARMGEVRGDWLRLWCFKPLSLPYLSFRLHCMRGGGMLSLVNPVFSGTEDGVWKKEGGTPL